MAAEITRMYTDRYKHSPLEYFPAVDISEIDVPAEVRQQLRIDNLKKLRTDPLEALPPLQLLERPTNLDNNAFGGHPINHIPAVLDEWLLEATFDEQLLELIDICSEKYQPDEFISQLVQIIVQFLNKAACFRTGAIATSLDVAHANRCISVIKLAWEKSLDADERDLLGLLLCDLTNGGDERWFHQLPNETKGFCLELMSKHL